MHPIHTLKDLNVSYTLYPFCPSKNSTMHGQPEANVVQEWRDM